MGELVFPLWGMQWWVRQCQTAAQRTRHVMVALMAAVSLTAIFSGKRGGCAHEV